MNAQTDQERIALGVARADQHQRLIDHLPPTHAAYVVIVAPFQLQAGRAVYLAEDWRTLGIHAPDTLTEGHVDQVQLAVEMWAAGARQALRQRRIHRPWDGS